MTICLAMIVKNEAPVIARCLASVRPLIDCWAIVDTGSTDGTQDIVREALRHMPGALFERPWHDFSTNRNQSLDLAAQSHSDYTLIIDADDTIEIPDGFVMPSLDADSYSIDIEFAGTRYRRPQLVRSALPWSYKGVIHEYLECKDAATQGHLPLLLRVNQDGARRRDPLTYRRDAEVLEKALESERDPMRRARYTFYLGQSYRDCGEPGKALDAYLSRSELGGWDQEVYVSLMNAGRLAERLGHPDEALAHYERATLICPSRAEAAHGASRLCRLREEFERGYAAAKPAVGLTAPQDGLFVEGWIYDYGLLDEFAVNAYWAGHPRECLDAALRALQIGKVPPSESPRFIDNARFGLDGMAA